MSVTKILFKQGTSAPSGQDFIGTNGEPLWDRNHKKLYVSNGTASPTLIGPIQADWNAAAGSPSAILNKPNIPLADMNDEIKDLSRTLTLIEDSSRYTEKMYMIGDPVEGITQYWLDLTDFYPTVTGVSEPLVYIDPLAMLHEVGTEKKITLFLTGVPGENDPNFGPFWEHTLFPMIWLSSESSTLALGTDSNFRIWESGVKIFDTKEFGNAISMTNGYGIQDLENADALEDYYSDGMKAIIENAKNGKYVKLEIIPTQIDANGVLIDIHITYPSNPAVVVSNLINTNNATPIATVNGNTIYAPYLNGQLAVTNGPGIVIDNTGAQQVIEASLSDYYHVGVVGGASSVSDANITKVSLTNADANTNGYLCVKETSAFGSDATVSYDSTTGTLSWTLSSESRSYATAVIDTAPDGGKVTVAVTGMATACQTDHYIYIYNSSAVPIEVAPDDPDSSWANYPVRGIPKPTFLKSDQGVEMSIALKRYPTSGLNTAVMTASEPLDGGNS